MPPLFHVRRRVALEQLEDLYLNTVSCQAPITFKVYRASDRAASKKSGINTSLSASLSHPVIERMHPRLYT